MEERAERSRRDGQSRSKENVEVENPPLTIEEATALLQALVGLKVDLAYQNLLTL